MHFQWYPGHMTKARRMMQENIKLIDLIIELVDARVPLSSRNPDIDELGKNKARLILLNKADLAEDRRNDEWLESSNGIGVEKTWPVHSPHVERVEVVRRGKVRRAKLNYLRQRVGKAAKVKELVK